MPRLPVILPRSVADTPPSLVESMMMSRSRPLITWQEILRRRRVKRRTKQFDTTASAGPGSLARYGKPPTVTVFGPDGDEVAVPVGAPRPRLRRVRP